MKDGCSCAAEGLLDLYFLQWPAEGDSAYFLNEVYCWDVCGMLPWSVTSVKTLDGFMSQSLLSNTNICFANDSQLQDKKRILSKICLDITSLTSEGYHIGWIYLLSSQVI